MADFTNKQSTERPSTAGQEQTAHAPDTEMRAINEHLVIAAIRHQELAETALRSEESAKRSGELYRLLTQNFPHGLVLLFDHDLRHVLAGGSGLNAPGFTKEALEGKTIRKGFTPQICRQIEPAYRAALTGQTTVLEVLIPVEAPAQHAHSQPAADRVFQFRTLPAVNDQGHILTGMAMVQDITEHRGAEEALRWQAYHDPLTGLPNRALLHDRLEQVLAMFRRSGELAALLFLDLNQFKQVNDTLGHAAGDSLLQIVAARLTNCVRAEDTVARLGGDEFVVLLPSVQNAGDAAQIAEAIVVLLEAPAMIADREVLVTVSLGISIFPFDAADGASLLKKADAAMYRSKMHHYSKVAHRSKADYSADHPPDIRSDTSLPNVNHSAEVRRKHRD